MKIAIQLDEKRNILDFNDTNDAIAEKKAKEIGWILAESNTAFLANESNLWTIREPDSMLVHVQTNQTPEEEKDAVITQLTLQNLSLVNDVADLKKLTTAQTLQSLQDAKDKSEQNEVITGLTKEILELKKNDTAETK